MKSSRDGAALSTLFPALRGGVTSPSGTVEFTLCTFPQCFLPIFTLGVELRSLTLTSCDFGGMSGAEIVGCVGKMKSLQSLSIEMKRPAVLPLAPLSQLQLSNLALSCCTVTGMNALSRLPLHKLVLNDNVKFSARERLVSNTLLSLSIDVLSPAFEFKKSQLPALKSLQFHTLSFEPVVSVSDFDHVKGWLSRLAELPLQIVGFAPTLIGPTSMENEGDCLSLMQIISSDPLEAFKKFKGRVYLEEWVICPGLMEVFSSLFPEVRRVDMTECVFNYPQGIIQAITHMPALCELVIKLSQSIPTSIISGLCLASQSGRSFQLVLHAPAAMREKLELLSDQWEQLGGSDVRLVLEIEDESSEEDSDDSD